MARANDLVLAEAAVFALARSMAKARAEELVKKACGVAVNEAKPLIEVVKKISEREITRGSIDWKSLAQPEKYLGASNEILDRVLETARRRFASNQPSRS